ncbi:MAG: hypothetical protein KJ884_22005 [Gammaproteobacteria bacterium]|nr:hypothetical protein [Gammaproteobacteria bacterium]MBU1488339.1 hypothetical protein [Gammaproteobacteria bacterium]MBU2066049.1 hypothetical protein [Gammaproteobacteria bacterium]MBU2139991.1 hypothetical protein [Gammaproteobacteria bacterium]MBU2218530.1 hypothetical protein [Gammaproteobacteria bacterium]
MSDLTPLFENNERWPALINNRRWRDLSVSRMAQLAPQYRLRPLPRV